MSTPPTTKNSTLMAGCTISRQRMISTIGWVLVIRMVFMMPTILKLVKSSGDRWTRSCIRVFPENQEILENPEHPLSSMPGGWMPLSLMCATALRCGIARPSADLLPLAPLQNISMLIRWLMPMQSITDSAASLSLLPTSPAYSS